MWLSGLLFWIAIFAFGAFVRSRSGRRAMMPLRDRGPAVYQDWLPIDHEGPEKVALKQDRHQSELQITAPSTPAPSLTVSTGLITQMKDRVHVSTRLPRMRAAALDGRLATFLLADPDVERAIAAVGSLDGLIIDGPVLTARFTGGADQVLGKVAPLCAIFHAMSAAAARPKQAFAASHGLEVQPDGTLTGVVGDYLVSIGDRFVELWLTHPLPLALKHTGPVPLAIGDLILDGRMASEAPIPPEMAARLSTDAVRGPLLELFDTHPGAWVGPESIRVDSPLSIVPVLEQSVALVRDLALALDGA